MSSGEELHNNHHAFPSSARLSSQWWEFDLSWLYIRALSALGLARIKRVAPRLTIIRGKALVDMDTLSAVVTSHLHVFARYTKEVLLGNLQDWCRQAEATGIQALERFAQNLKGFSLTSMGTVRGRAPADSRGWPPRSRAGRGSR
jgi:hypothetical protein